jgi:hypothetical protein
MILLHRHKVFAKRPWLIVAIAVVSLLLIAGGVWLLLANQASSQYRAKFDTYKQDARSALANAVKAFESVPDATKRAEALVSLSNAAKKQMESLPPLPTVVGIGIASSQDKSARQNIESKLMQFTIEATDAKGLLDYQSMLNTTLTELSAKQGNNADEQKALADAWLAAASKIKELTPPQELTQTREQLVAAATMTQATLAALPGLYNDKDYSGFAAKQEELKTHAAAIRALADAFKQAAENQDKALASSYKAVLDALK